jgi:putative oxidoreductase
VRFDYPLLPLLGRLMIVYIFATSGLAKALGWEGNIRYMSTRHVPAVALLLAIAMVIELAGSLCLILGYRTREAAFIMFLYLTAVTFIYHDYWNISGMARGGMETHFRKNLGIMGGLLILAYAGAGRWALDAVRERRQYNHRAESRTVHGSQTATAVPVRDSRI